MSKGRLSRLFAAILCVCAFAAAAESAQVIYVDDDAAEVGDGSSWGSACRHLQDALAIATAAAKPVEVRVAQGLYKPDRGASVVAGDRLAAFHLVSGVLLRGGYGGAASPDPNACDPERYETVLSGDLQGDDVEAAEPNGLVGSFNEPTRVDNSVHVVMGSGVDETAVLDGFVITAGYAAGAGLPPSFSGGGMLIESGSPRIIRCQFLGNISLSRGGGVCNQNSAVAFSDCVFRRNFASGGAAMYNDASHVEAAGCTFTGQVALSRGGAVFNEWNSELSLKRCGFADNKAEQSGGAVYSYLDCPVHLEDCTFEGNQTNRVGEGGALWSLADVTAVRCVFRGNLAARDGGAIYTNSGALLVSHCSFTGNRTELERYGEGGAIRMTWDTMATIEDSDFEDNAAPNGGAVSAYRGHARITRCRFRNNSVLTSPLPSSFRVGGGAIAASSANMKLTDCDLQGNRARSGGAVRGEYATNLAFTNCILAGNRAERSGGIDMTGGNLRLINCTLASNVGADGHAMTGRGILEHCIVWDGGDLYAGVFGAITAVYSDVQGGYPGQGNLDADPLFVHPGRWADADDASVVLGPEDPNAVWLPGDYHLQSQAGHWDPDANDYVVDAATSPCIDAGDWATPVGDEPFPNGGVLNLGAYGGTPQASRSYFGEPVCEGPIPGDINGDCKIDSIDTELALQDWRVSGAPTANQPPTVVITAPADGAVVTVSASKPTIPIVVEASDADGSINQVSFSTERRVEGGYSRTASLDSDGSDGWAWDWRFLEASNGYEPGQYTITVYAIDDDCEIAFASKVRITVLVTK